MVVLLYNTAIGNTVVLLTDDCGVNLRWLASGWTENGFCNNYNIETRVLRSRIRELAFIIKQCCENNEKQNSYTCYRETFCTLSSPDTHLVCLWAVPLVHMHDLQNLTLII